MNKSINKNKKHVNVMTPDEVYALSCIVRKFYGRYFAFPCNSLVLYNFNDVKDETVTIEKAEIEEDGRMDFLTFADTVYSLRRKDAYPYREDGTPDKNLIAGFLDYAAGDKDMTWIEVQVSGKIIPYIIRKCIETPVNIKESVVWR